jgi:N-acetylglucosaminyldiphosphoundecaprenol N-acetyl-beta-D-mannosaminyltransferase
MLFCNINFNIKNKYDLFFYEDKTKLIFTANVATIAEANRTEKLYKILNKHNVTFDGQIPLVLARFISREKGYMKLSGSDIIYDFCAFAAEKGYSLFILGAEKKYNEIAVNILKNKYDIKIRGYSPEFEAYPFSRQFDESSIAEIKKFKPEILFVGFGQPKQEYWVDDNYEILSKMNVKYVICCGGTIDFVANKFKRAPKFIQRLGLEGIYRIIQEPTKARINRFIFAMNFFKYVNNLPDFKR